MPLVLMILGFIWLVAAGSSHPRLPVCAPEELAAGDGPSTQGMDR